MVQNSVGLTTYYEYRAAALNKNNKGPAKAGQVLERLRRGFSEFAPWPRANSVLASCLDTAKFEYSSCLGSCLIFSVSDLELLNFSII